MLSLLLPLIYLSFISLGLPDAMLGSAWPAMSVSLGRAVPDLGLVALLGTLGAMLSSLSSSRLIRRFGTGRVLLASVALTALMMLLYAFSGSYLAVCLLALPLGMGGGAVDAGLNGFVARNYKASHMSWLHFMWGLGATLGPLIISFNLRTPAGWQGGYKSAALMQAGLLAVLLFSLPLWRKAERLDSQAPSPAASLKLTQVLRIPGIKTTMLAYACFVGFEYTASVWAASFLEQIKGFSEADAALFSAVYFFGTTAGRGVSGVLALRVDSRRQIKMGCLLAFAGALLLALPLPRAVTVAGYLLLGLGNAPIFPSLTYLTPERFGLAVSQSAIGLQMAAAYAGSTIMPPLTAFLVRVSSLRIVPLLILLLIVIAFYLSQRIDKRIAASA